MDERTKPACSLGFRVEGLGLVGVECIGNGLRVLGGVQGLGFGIRIYCFSAYDSGFTVQGLGFRV